MKVKDQIRCELSRREFYHYCKTLHPSFYKDDRPYLKTLCDSLQDFYYNDNEFMIVNIGPRHGKSFTATNFVAWLLGKNPKEKIISGSYNEDLSKMFSKTIRNTIDTEKMGDNIVYSDIFPTTQIKHGSAEAKKWQTSESDQVNYLATSPTGTATGFGANLEIIDDLIKNAEEANNETTLENHWNWFVNTMLSRREGKKKVLIIMTRWNDNDLAGRVLEYVKQKGYSYSHVNMKTYEDGKMLCDSIFNYDDYIKAREIMGEDIFSANYQQEPINLKGRLYEYFLTYDELPPIKAIENYTDTADTGADYLASITYAVGLDNKAYILDIVYTKAPMEVTENLVSDMITKHNVNWCRIESNNGGRGFSRNVERLAKDKGNYTTMFKPFTQTANKQSRMLTNSTGVMQNVLYPKNWETIYREAYNDLFKYQREGKNKHDDIVDCVTGVYEVLDKRYKRKGNGSGLRL